MTNLYIKKLHPDVITPKRATKYSSAFDVHAFIPDDQTISLSPGQTKLIPTGFCLQAEEGYDVKLYARSGLSLKVGLNLGNSVAVIDHDYFSPVGVIAHNNSANHVDINHQMRICQLKVERVIPTTIIEVTELPELDSDRRSGYGSTGT